MCLRRATPSGRSDPRQLAAPVQSRPGNEAAFYFGHDWGQVPCIEPGDGHMPKSATTLVSQGNMTADIVAAITKV
jgi:hypothetical protein